MSIKIICYDFFLFRYFEAKKKVGFVFAYYRQIASYTYESLLSLMTGVILYDNV